MAVLAWPLRAEAVRVTVTHAHEALAEALGIAAEELDGLIDRLFAANRRLIVSNDERKFWTAAIGDNVLYRSPDGAATWRFAKTFADRTPGVTAVLAGDNAAELVAVEFSVRVPDNVIQLPVRETA